MEDSKVTSITLPLEWWQTLQRLATLRKVQDDGKGKSFNSLLVEMIEDHMPQARLELAEREGRRR